MRSRTWLTIMQLVKDGKDMMKVVDLIPMLHEGGGALPSLFAETLETILHPQTLIFRSLRATRLPTSCPRGVRQLCKIQHNPSPERGTLANPLKDHFCTKWYGILEELRFAF